MENFLIDFLTSNLLLTFIISLLLVFKYLLRNHLTARMQYHLWLPLLLLLAVPFLPFSFFGFADFTSQYKSVFTQSVASLVPNGTMSNTAPSLLSSNWMNDFAESMNRSSASLFWNILFILWVIGAAVTLLRFLSSLRDLRALRRSSFPLEQADNVYGIYHRCTQEMCLSYAPSIYITKDLASPAITGVFRPRIYLPWRMINNYGDNELRFMLLHELQHYRHKDHWINFAMVPARILYWFHPLVWYAFQHMRNDQELACDASVLPMLKNTERKDYGYTLLRLAQQISHTAFPIVSGIGGDFHQTKRRILAIANYRIFSKGKCLRGHLLYGLIAALLLGLSPLLSAAAHEPDRYDDAEILSDTARLSLTDYHALFHEFDGSFVLYDGKNDTWDIYNDSLASTRVSPNSTYKIYDALLGLESGIITPEQSFMKWNGTVRSFDAWNQNQTLRSAMTNSVNWYFQTIDEIAGKMQTEAFFKEIQYGNQDLSGALSSYWMESSLKISPLEQVQLLKKFYYNEFGFAPENIQAVKDALLLERTADTALYGKTGTGQISGQNCSGWFVGYVVKNGSPYFFALNIQGTNACGSAAAQIVQEILMQRELL